MLYCIFDRAGTFHGGVLTTGGAFKSTSMDQNTKKLLQWSQIENEGVPLLKINSSTSELIDELVMIPFKHTAFAKTFVRYVEIYGFQAIALEGKTRIDIAKRLIKTAGYSKSSFQLIRTLAFWPEQELEGFVHACEVGA